MSITDCKVHVEFTRRPDGEKRYSCTLSLTSALDGVGGQGHAPADLPRKREAVAILWEAGWAAGLVWKDSTNLIRSPERPVRSESLYRLSYPDPHNLLYCHVVI